MTEPSNEPTIRAAFEECLIEGMKGAPLTNKEGALVTTPDGEIVKTAPEASFLSVVRAYLKDLLGDGKPKAPQTGKPQGILAEYAASKKLPFGVRPQ